MNERLWGILVDSFPKLLEYGVKVTVPLTALSFALALVIAVIVAMIQYANVRLLRQVCRFYIWIVRGTPLLVQLYVVFYGLPNLGLMIAPFPSAILVFSLNEGAYCAETLRAAIRSVPVHQMEAARSLGFSWLRSMRYVILPQAFRTAFPPLSNSLIGMVKDTSLAANITVMEMFMVTQRIASRYYEHLALYIEVALVYLLFCTVLTRVQSRVERRLSHYGF